MAVLQFQTVDEDCQFIYLNGGLNITTLLVPDQCQDGVVVVVGGEAPNQGEDIHTIVVPGDK